MCEPTLWDTSRLRRIRNITVLHQIGLLFFFFVSVSVLSSAQIKNTPIDNPNHPFQTIHQFSLFTSSQFTLLDLSIYIGMVNTYSAKWVASGHPLRLPGSPCFMSLNHHTVSCFCVFFAIICACRNVCIWEWSTAILYY